MYSCTRGPPWHDSALVGLFCSFYVTRGGVERRISRLAISDSRDDRLRALDISPFLGDIHVMRTVARFRDLKILLRETDQAARESPILCDGDQFALAAFNVGLDQVDSK